MIDRASDRILAENPHQGAAIQGRERIGKRLLDEAIQLCDQECLPAAEERFQLLFARGFDDQAIRRQRELQYDVKSFVVSGEWSPSLEIGEKFIEIVSDGTFEIGNADLTSGGTFHFLGRKQVDLGILDIRLRSRAGNRQVTVFSARSNQASLLTNSMGSRPKARKRPVIISIIRPGSGSKAITSPPEPFLQGDATVFSSTASSQEERARQTAPTPAGLVAHRPAGRETALPAGGPVPIVLYRARISHRDHFNSKGRNLAEIPEIKLQDFLQQDCYNRLRLGLSDPDDESPSRAYEWLSVQFQNPLTSDTSASCLQAVLRGAPLLEVSIFDSWIRVRLINP